MVDFSGWEMPVQYAGTIQEHQAVRNHVGIFDVSHMGRVIVEGPEAEKFLDYLSTNKVAGKKDGSATYTVLTNERGGCVDDVIIYRCDSTHFFLIVNAGNRAKDFDHLSLYAKGFDVNVYHRFAEEGILAVQGPNALALVSEIFPEASSMKPFTFAEVSYNGTPLFLSRTGYTGEKGVELYVPIEVLVELWDALMAKGEAYGIQPIGLGARDTLRLEVGYALYGHELSDGIAPTESVSAWTVKFPKGEFLGKDALLELEHSPQKRRAYGVVLEDRGIAREGYSVSVDGRKSGVVTSGTHSPSLNKAIALILVDKELKEGDHVTVDIRNRPCKATVVDLPFYKKA